MSDLLSILFGITALCLSIYIILRHRTNEPAIPEQPPIVVMFEFVGGPLCGRRQSLPNIALLDVYVADESGNVHVYSRSGEQLHWAEQITADQL